MSKYVHCTEQLPFIFANYFALDNEFCVFHSGYRIHVHSSCVNTNHRYRCTKCEASRLCGSFPQ